VEKLVPGGEDGMCSFIETKYLVPWIKHMTFLVTTHALPMSQSIIRVCFYAHTIYNYFVQVPNGGVAKKDTH
jgi:hypothetical protein